MTTTYAHARSTVSLSLTGIGKRTLGSNALTIESSTSRRIPITRPRMNMGFDVYRPNEPGYAMADVNATHRLSSRIDGVLQIRNLTDYYPNDFSADYAVLGRVSSAGFRVRW
jgi:hypothetical protein